MIKRMVISGTGLLNKLLCETANKENDMSDRIYFYTSMICGLLNNQVENWQKKINYPLRFILFWALGLYAGSIAFLISKLPDGSIELMLGNIFHPVVAFCLAIVTGFSMLAAYCLILADKIKATL